MYGRSTVWALGCALALAPAALGAQGVVSGQITLKEKPGETSQDLGNAVIYLEPETPQHFTLKAMHVTLAMHGREYLPHVSVLTVGSRVRFQNQDPFRHNAFTHSTAGSFDYGLSERGTTHEHRLKKPGLFPVFCDIHSKMSAFILVVGTPYFAQAGDDGQFSIRDVPAGTYTMHVWHERGGVMVQTFTLGKGGKSDASVELDARGYRRYPHKNKSGQDYYSSDEAERY